MTDAAQTVHTRALRAAAHPHPHAGGRGDKYGCPAADEICDRLQTLVFRVTTVELGAGVQPGQLPIDQIQVCWGRAGELGRAGECLSLLALGCFDPGAVSLCAL